jgi:hypothetical protein
MSLRSADPRQPLTTLELPKSFKICAGLGHEAALKWSGILSIGEAMPQYESRIIKPTGAIAATSQATYLNASSAIRAALKLCRDGEWAEVWDGDVCIYSECPTHIQEMVWLPHDEAPSS